MVPRILIRICSAGTRFAFLLTPMLDRIAVTQVPMFAPMTIGIAMPKLIFPVRESD